MQSGNTSEECSITKPTKCTMMSEHLYETCSN